MASAQIKRIIDGQSKLESMLWAMSCISAQPNLDKVVARVIQYNVDGTLALLADRLQSDECVTPHHVEAMILLETAKRYDTNGNDYDDSMIKMWCRLAVMVVEQV